MFIERNANDMQAHIQFHPGVRYDRVYEPWVAVPPLAVPYSTVPYRFSSAPIVRVRIRLCTRTVQPCDVRVRAQYSYGVCV